MEITQPQPIFITRLNVTFHCFLMYPWESSPVACWHGAPVKLIPSPLSLFLAARPVMHHVMNAVSRKNKQIMYLSR